jgi:hypothetical protein
MNSDDFLLENQLRQTPLPCVPPDWRNRILAKAEASRIPPRPTGIVFWPHAAFWLATAAAWIVAGILALTGPERSDLRGALGLRKPEKRDGPTYFEYVLRYRDFPPLETPDVRSQPKM